MFAFVTKNGGVSIHLRNYSVILTFCLYKLLFFHLSHEILFDKSFELFLYTHWTFLLIGIQLFDI